METQFKIKKFSNNIYEIQETWFKEHANLYLFKGEESCLLIDAGLGLFDIKKFLESKGFKNIKVALTHAHFDHFGGIKSFLPKEILVTEKIYKNIKNKQFWGLNYLKPKDFSRKTDFNNTRKLFESNIFFATQKNIKNICVGEFNFKIIETPGHTDDSVVYFDKKNKILVSGDTLYNGKTYSDFPNSNLKEFKKSLHKISDLDFKILLPGHNEQMNKIQTEKIIKKWLTDIN